MGRILKHSEIQQPLRCSVSRSYCTPFCIEGNLWGPDQPNENYIHNHNTPAYEAYIMQQMSIGGHGV